MPGFKIAHQIKNENEEDIPDNLQAHVKKRKQNQRSKENLLIKKAKFEPIDKEEIADSLTEPGLQRDIILKTEPEVKKPIEKVLDNSQTERTCLTPFIRITRNRAKRLCEPSTTLNKTSKQKSDLNIKGESALNKSNNNLTIRKNARKKSKDLKATVKKRTERSSSADANNNRYITETSSTKKRTEISNDADAKNNRPTKETSLTKKRTETSNDANAKNDRPTKETSLTKKRKQKFVDSTRIKSQKIMQKGLNKFVGAHLSITGGIENVIHQARQIGAQAVGLFLKSQRTWKSKPLEEKAVEKFKAACEVHKYPLNKILPHGSYLLNCGSSKEELLTKSRENLIDDLTRCDRLGIQLFNFHPGSTCGEISIAECIQRIAESINIAHSQTKQVTVVIENMSCQGNTIGGRFEELRDIITQVEDKGRIGVCLDTCHAFAAGFDMRTEAGYEQMMTDFDNIIGLNYLKAIHLNDSKGDVGCHKDRHENIGEGKIGLDGFSYIMNDPRLDDIPMILETPLTIDDQKEIEILYGLIK